MAWMSADCFQGTTATSCLGLAADNTTDIERQATEALRRAAAGQLTDLSPTTYKFGPNGTVLHDRCGAVCERLQPRFAGAGLKVLPLVAAFGIRPIVEYALNHPADAARNLVDLTLTHGYAGINLDLEPLDCQNCVSPSNCTVETRLLLAFLDVVAAALHAHGKELQIDYAAWMQTHNFGSYSAVAATKVDTIASMDTYGKLGDVFGWITQLNAVASCELPAGVLGGYPCNGRLKLSAGFWPLQPVAQYQGGEPDPTTAAVVLSGNPPNGVGFEQAKGRGVRQLCIWDAFGETWSNATGGARLGVHQSIEEYWWTGFGRFLALP